MGPVWLSLQVALTATLLSGVGGVALAGLLSMRRVPLKGLVDGLFTTPLVFPPTVLGYYLLVALGRQSAVGHAWEAVFGGPLVFTRSGAVVAAVVTSFPFVFQGARAALESVDPTLLDAARTLGATPARAFVRVALPLASRGIVAGLVLGFARSLGDFGLTLMVAGNIPGETQTAALAIYDAILAGRDADARALVLTMTAFALALMVAAQVLARRPHAR
ncbi:MAG: molybdate ABC transporter permease subunit [Myxococcales bacterium]|nr:molybdate ABC transporter permease subunit [Myxococcales bacterium]